MLNVINKTKKSKPYYNKKRAYKGKKGKRGKGNWNKKIYKTSVINIYTHTYYNISMYVIVFVNLLWKK